MEGKGSRRKRDSLTPHSCEIPFCNYKLFFQRHRIVPGREGGRYKLGNVIALCPNHHAEADADMWEREDLLAIVRRRVEAEEEYERSRSDEAESTDLEELEGCWSSSAEEPHEGDGVGSSDAADDPQGWIAPV